MFKNIQKQLLLKYPLIWNTKFISMLIIGIIYHIIYFILGYFEGTIDFSNKSKYDIEFQSVMFGVLLTIILTILWLVNYFKNNSLKSFYSKSKYALFYEWFQIFIICTFLISFYLPFSFGKQLHQRNYYSYEETQKRCEIISLADIFIDGSFSQTEINSLKSDLIDESNHSKINDTTINNTIDKTEEYVNEIEEQVEQISHYTYKNYIVFNGKKYDEFSLLNRNVFHFTINSNEKDSINKIKVKTWLQNDDKQEIKSLMSAYLRMINEHHLSTNLTLNEWLDITYKSPLFKDFLYITPYKNEYETNRYYNYYNDSRMRQSTEQNERYSKYFVQQNVLKDKYETVSEAYTNPIIKYDEILAYFYGALGFSLLIFSFRVTTGKSWLIAVLTVGIINIILGIFSALGSSSNIYLYLSLFTILVISFYFFLIYNNKRSLDLSRIALNILLWCFPLIIPILYFIVREHYLRYHYYSDEYSQYISPEYRWLENNISEIFLINFILSIVALFFLSRIIRNWKGLAEN